MQSLEYTNRDVERKLGLSGSYLSRLFSGLVDLKVDHIVSISRAVGLEPEEMFQFAFPKRKRSPTVAALRVREALAQARQDEGEAGEPLEELDDDAAPPPALALTKSLPPSELEQAMERLMARTIRRLIERQA